MTESTRTGDLVGQVVEQRAILFPPQPAKVSSKARVRDTALGTEAPAT